jgi:uncharacterized protein (TIGR03435 family)
MSSAGLLEPGVFGVFRPVLLLPEGIDQRLTPQQLQAIIAHELCHIRRRDNLTAALHMVVEAIFWFHPLVWWIGSRLVDERERACDEEVLQSGSSPETYAEGILNVCKFYVESPLTCVSGVTGSDLKKRIESIMTTRIVRSMSFGRKLLLGAAGTAAFALPIAIGILNTPNGRAQTPPRFEVASIRPNVSADTNGTWRFSEGGRFTGENIQARLLITTAYQLHDFQISTAPGCCIQIKLDAEKYDIVAKSEGNPSEDQIVSMLQGLLVDRFKFKYHTVTKEAPVYALVAAKSGIKVQPSKESSGKYFWRRTQIEATGVTMKQFAVALASQLDRPVLDKTGFGQTFDAKLQWNPDVDSDGPSIFNAIQEQLGLKLEPRKGPVEILVIDHIENPSEN